MARKKYEAAREVTKELLKSREKRKWQISLRRYVLERSPCPAYAPYFGLDVQNIRDWFESQFKPGMNWENFGKQWQFDHVIPVAWFDQTDDQDLRMCWNFTNLRTTPVAEAATNRPELSAAVNYFKDLFEATKFRITLALKEKAEQIIKSGALASEIQVDFITARASLLKQIENYSSFEFELLNLGRSVEEVNKEMELFGKKSPN